jgi:hypothetical protein
MPDTLPGGRRIDPWFAVLAWWPVLWHCCGAAIAWFLPAPWWWWFVPAWILLLPAILCRVSDRCWPVRGVHPAASAAARRWWWQQQLQMPFNRVALIEEVMRLVPGLYQCWLWLWGSRVSPLCVFAPEVAVTDRHLLRIGRAAIIGHGCLLGGHLVHRGEGGWMVRVDVVTVGSGAVIGARALLAPGSSVAADEEFTATLPLPPGHRWEGGRRIKDPAHDG